MGLFKKSEKQEKPTYIFQDSKVYFEYNMKLQEKIAMFIIGFVVGIIVGYVFYSLLWVSVFWGIIVGVLLIPLRKIQQVNKQINVLKVQFRAMLESISTSIGAGRNVMDSFINAVVDLREQFSAEAYIVKETENIVHGLNNNINIENLLLDMADRSGIDDIRTFADVFATCYRKGGDIKEVVTSTYKIINDKIEIEMEINTMVTSAKTELTMMCCMPVVFVMVLNSMGSNITGRGTMSGYIATTVAIVIFVASYFIGQKIMAIKV